MVTNRPARPSWCGTVPTSLPNLNWSESCQYELSAWICRLVWLELDQTCILMCILKINPSQKKITRAALGLLGTFSMSGGGWVGVGGGREDLWQAWNWSFDMRANERPKKQWETALLPWVLLCSPGTQWRRTTHGRTWQLYERIGPFGPIQWKENLFGYLPILTSSSPASPGIF